VTSRIGDSLVISTRKMYSCTQTADTNPVHRNNMSEEICIQEKETYARDPQKNIYIYSRTQHAVTKPVHCNTMSKKTYVYEKKSTRKTK